MVDLHTHILPTIDDGAQNLEDSYHILKECFENGITKIIFTPHFYSEYLSISDFLVRRERAENRISPIAQKLGIQYKLGAEIRYTPLLAEFPLTELAFGTTQYLLLELYTMYQPHNVEELIKRVSNKGFIPILAHIERYPYIYDDPLLLYSWVKAGALTQINAEWVIKHKKAIKYIKKWDSWNLLHLMASDTHASDERPQNLPFAYDKLPKDIAQKFKNNALKIFDGKELIKEIPVKPQRFMNHWR